MIVLRVMFGNNFNLINPIAFVDVASTSLELTKARIVRISVLKFSSSGSKQYKSHLINPECDIPEDASNIHLINISFKKEKNKNITELNIIQTTYYYIIIINIILKDVVI